MQEENPVRGYFSSVDQQLIFGLGKNDQVDSIQVIWPDNKRQTDKKFSCRYHFRVFWKNALPYKPLNRYKSVAFYRYHFVFRDFIQTPGKCL